jgi:hypothetical protein
VRGQDDEDAANEGTAVHINVVNPVLPPQTDEDQDESREAALRSTDFSEHYSVHSDILSTLTIFRGVVGAEKYILRKRGEVRIFGNDCNEPKLLLRIK